MRSAAIAALFLSMVAVAQPQQANKPDSATRRLALVIGNQNYSKFPSLTAAPKEAGLIVSALERAGFKVTQANNIKVAELGPALQGFVDQVQPGDICLFYFSGYALQDPDTDFLLPIDFDPALFGKLRSRAYPVTKLAQDLDSKQAGLKMLFLEGSRKIEAADASLGGLLIPDTGDLTEVLFAIPTVANQYIDTAPGQVGFFTAALAEMIDREGLPITQLMPEILRSVMDKSKNQQRPANGSTVTLDFYFHARKLPPPPPQQNHKDREFYVWIGPGTFLMGCASTDDKCDKNEMPQHKVTLTQGFWMGQNEVQVVSYKKFLDANKKKEKLKMPRADKINKNWTVDNYPISGMTWQNAVDYCSWAGGRLPTEAEWEYAARGGKEDQIYPFDTTDQQKSREKANFYGKAGNDRWEDIAPVKQFDANGYGLYDMAGNVWEFVSDFYGIYTSAPATDPKGPEDGKVHVRRGGSFDSDPKKHLRISVRVKSEAEINVGFRCVMDETPDTRQLFKDQ